jgi:D-xylose transport system ATP-binding protein
MALLELEGIGKSFPGVKALDGVSFTLNEGEIHALCGENGAGKSTLIKILCGHWPAGSYEGVIRLRGEIVRFRNMRDAEANAIALIAQELALVPGLSVAENMLLGRTPTRRGLIDWDLVRREAQRGLDRVGLSVDPDRPVRELGIGQQQTVEIAKALLKDARILVLDEPTAALTHADAQKLLGLLDELRKRGVSCIYISHRLEEVFQVADRVTVLRDGRSIWTQPASALDKDKVIAAMVGRSVENLHPRPPAPEGPVALRVRDLSLDDPDGRSRRTLEGIDFEVRRGEVLGVAGLMGAGRTALVSTLFGANTSRARGEITVEGRASTAPFRGVAEAIGAGVALVSEDRKRYGLALEASLLDNFTLATLGRFSKAGLIDHDARGAAAQAQFEALRVRAPDLSALARNLSGGNQQKIVLGKWLMTEPRILLLDEPTRGIDVGAKAEIYELIGKLAARGLAVVLVSSDLPEVLGMSHRVLVLNQGRQTALFDHAEATAERVMAAATRKV